MITRLSSVIRPEGSDLVFDHPYNADFAWLAIALNRPRVGRRVPGYGRCLSAGTGSGSRAILISARKYRRSAARDAAARSLRSRAGSAVKLVNPALAAVAAR